MKVQIADFRIPSLGGRRILPPVQTRASAGERIEIEWYPQEWVMVHSVTAWRLPPGAEGITPITPLMSLGASLSAEEYAVGPAWCSAAPGGAVPLPELSLLWAAARTWPVIGPSRRFAIRMRADAEVPVETGVLVAVAVELPPECFRPRAAA